MPNTPQNALPYPLATDPVSAGASNIQALATALDNKVLGTIVRAAAALILQSKLAIGDANPSGYVDNYGTMRWGVGGATAYDVNLYRSGVGTLHTIGAFEAEGLVVANQGKAAQILLHVDGTIRLGASSDAIL